MTYNPHIHHRKSIRLKGYDYAQAGLYFITICRQNRTCLFGNVENREMILNNAGNTVEHGYCELENKYNDIKFHEMVVMPNHFHCIVQNVGADLRVCQNTENVEKISDASPLSGEPPLSGEHIGSPLHRVMQWFKTMTPIIIFVG